ncbi:helix-turn-helix transcriptional regulator [Cohnella soli]|uniref:Helix-turn-helix transcriptional regulator n=1 Tax=Cohnella soli TaxID=425005 RepID=A0ABW0I2Q0_9BACL
MMNKYRLFSLPKNSLLLRLLSGFLGIIVLLLSFNALSFSFFQTKIKNEIIHANQLNLSKTTDSYENHLQLIDNMLSSFFFDETVSAFKNNPSPIEYELYFRIRDKLNALLTNPLLHLNNILFYFQKPGVVVDASGFDNAGEAFSSRYVNMAYPPQFWEMQFLRDDRLRLLPAANFSSINPDRTKRSVGNLLPVVIKNKFEDFYIIAFLNADKLFQSFQVSDPSTFHMQDSDGALLYHYGSQGQQIEFAQEDLAKGYVKHGSDYAFVKTGAKTGITYVQSIPNGKIASEVARLNALLVVLLIVAIVAAVLISIILSIRFNTPIKAIIQSLNKMNPDIALGSNINEYVMIREKFQHLLQSNRDIHSDLTNKNKLLRNYGYITHLKSIYSDQKEMTKLTETKKPFYLVLFDLTYTQQFSHVLGIGQDRASYAIKELVALHLSEEFGEAVTLQVEKEQIVSLLFTDESIQQVWQALHTTLKPMFDFDKDYCVLTIAVYPEKTDMLGFPEAYEQTVDMLGQHKLTHETQIITAYEPQTMKYVFTAAEEQEFFTNLLAGNKKNAIALVRRILEHMRKRDLGAFHYKQFAVEVTTKAIKALISYNLDISAVLKHFSPEQHMKKAVSVEQYVEFFERLLTQTTDSIHLHKSVEDPIVTFVMNYLNANYDLDVTQESVADKLNISSGHLSAHFKEKTGTHFSDYLNDIRIANAKDMLKNTSFKIQEIAEKIGYQNVNSFIRMFKKGTGVTPGEFRRSIVAE